MFRLPHIVFKGWHRTRQRVTPLSQGQSHWNDLTTATANYNMGANRLQNLSAGSSAGDAISYGQGGASLNGLNLNSNTLSGMAPATASGQALAYAQNGAQLKTNNAAIAVVSSSLGGPSATPLVITAPANIASGNTLVFIAGAGSVPVFTLPSGFTQIRNDAGSWSQTIACKTAAGSEPGSYSSAFTGGANATGAIFQLSNTECAHLDASSGGFANSGNSFTIPSVTTTQGNESIFALGSQYCGNVPILSVGRVYVAHANLAVSGYSQVVPGASPTVAFGPDTSCGTAFIAAAQLAFIPTATVQASPLITNQTGAQV
jgi:hypothetical protein